MQENKTSRAFLVTAVVLGVMATVLSFAYLQNNSAKEAAPTIEIVAASHDLRAGAPLDPDKDLKKMEIERKGVMPERVVLLGEISRYKGMHINRDIQAGTPIWHADFVAPPMEVTGNWRAFTIPIRGATAQFLDPGDYVKVMVTRPLLHPRVAGADAVSGQTPGPQGAGNSPQWETVMVSPNPLKVLAVGSRTTRRYGYYEGGTPDSNQSVTLEVTEDQAKDILEQTGGGAKMTISTVEMPNSLCHGNLPCKLKPVIFPESLCA